MAARKKTTSKATAAAKKKFDAEVRKVRQSMTKVKDELKAAEKKARGYIATNPGKAVAMAAAAGVLAGTIATMVVKHRKSAASTEA